MPGKTTHKPSIFSFFSGAGFLDLGFENEGFSVDYVNEYHQSFVAAYHHSRKVLKLTPPRFGYETVGIEDIDLSLLNKNVTIMKSKGHAVGFFGGGHLVQISLLLEKTRVEMAKMVTCLKSMLI
jgi:DNA (cytosine-5)-methyltransferase 1